MSELGLYLSLLLLTSRSRLDVDGGCILVESDSLAELPKYLRIEVYNYAIHETSTIRPNNT